MLAIPLLWFAVLRGSGCVVIHGAEIRPRDLAASVTAFQGVENPDAVLAPAPQLGVRKTVNVALLNDWLSKSNPQKAVNQKSSRPQEEVPAAFCVEQERTVLSKAIVEQSIRDLLPKVDIVLIVEKYSQIFLPRGRLSFALSGATQPSAAHPDAPLLWRGLWFSDQGGTTPVWASVRAFRFLPEVRLKVSLPAGSRLNETQLETVLAVRSAFTERGDEIPEQYAGKLLKRFCAKGSALSARVVESPPIIRKGDVVPVKIVSGDLSLKLTARAETDGWSGQVIPFVIPAGHRRFRAQVQREGFALLTVSQKFDAIQD